MEQLDAEMDELDGAYANEFASLSDSLGFGTLPQGAPAPSSSTKDHQTD